MPGQIVNISWKEAVSETALKCGDPFFKDFPKNIYSQAVFRAERGIAKDFGIIDRELEITNEDASEELNIGPLNFNGEWYVTLRRLDNTAGLLDGQVLRDSSIEIKRVQWEELNQVTASSVYAIKYVGNRYVFKYPDPAIGDVIKIYYTSSIAGEEDYEYYDNFGNVNLIPVLPNKYYEETVRRACIYIAKLGMTNFQGIKSKKYEKVLGLYQKQSDLGEEKHLDVSRPWMKIKVFSAEYP